MRRKIFFIINPISGGNKYVNIMMRVLEHTLRKNQCDYDVSFTKYAGHATELAKIAQDKNYDVVAAVGGDGTVNEVARSLINTSVSLGIIPRGSGDGLARGLSIPLWLRRAANVLCTGSPRRIDAGKIDERVFFATAGMGFDAVVGKLFNEGSSRGPLPYFYISAKEFFTYEPKEYILRFNDREIIVKALILAAANTNQFGNGAMIGPMAQPDDGLLDICILKNISALKAIRHLPKLFTGKLIKTDFYEFYKTRELTIIRPCKAPIHVDGEAIDGDTHLHLSILPAVLSVIVPTNNHQT
ncbi:diacylglycerol kinase family lipid kinase [candidate division KSB1 bacterium]|nr:diacylglycerol kinase family lipid kinase [candidate division KSB1 bacterium]